MSISTVEFLKIIEENPDKNFVKALAKAALKNEQKQYQDAIPKAVTWLDKAINISERQKAKTKADGPFVYQGFKTEPTAIDFFFSHRS